ncbi:hypothetical protein A2714_03420 [Candidatus Woesebacteria bacterium RIFCSPHIGHO2_01_FULL_38_9]|uniref:PIN domain-containing protein n=2 Tax=Candidatus Woeseibacteriota TaxID=1752722 RepID=A0A1F7Y0B0_9BACT|nr:MAG: hypothetical protein A2714_03420 [Candidatus Woesebacteria bacterium RIFCSPHIGHO2_01_FULL_38_9]OGM63894.1 MAG: hypothetical protein A2893_00055 [Candidatus Woesebacteria bacterium RIFCSPLOWO2_01_FULL_39_25]
MLLDSTAFIDFTREYKPAVEAFDKLLHGQSTSIVTKLELVVGQQTKRDIKKISSMLDNLEIDVIQINEDVSMMAEDILTKYYHSYGIGILDAFIAATALVYNQELATRNTKHFDFIPNLKLIKPY